MTPKRYQYIFVLLREEIQKPDSIKLFEWNQMKQDVKAMLKQGYGQCLHTEMQHFYNNYLCENLESFHALDFIYFVAQQDECIGAWATGKVDLIKLTEYWTEQGYSQPLLALLTQLGQTGYETDWGKLRTTLDEKLCRMEVDGTRNGMKETGYFYCLLHAFTMIMMSAHPMTKKMELLEQFSQQWNFLRYMYSVMTRTIIGFRFSNFAQVTNNLTNDKNFEPDHHLYHSPLKERFNELCDKGTKKDKLQRALLKLEEQMTQIAPSN